MKYLLLISALFVCAWQGCTMNINKNINGYNANGKPHGKWKFFDEKGRLEKISMYVKGEESKILKQKKVRANE